MLIRFGMSNFGAARDPIELSLVSAKSIKDEGVSLLETRASKQPLLPFALIYGANGSGKTTAWRGLRQMQAHVLNSFSKLDADDRVPNKVFALDPEATQIPTIFDIDFIKNETRYHYGFSILDGKFHEEWLYFYPEGNRRMLFHRTEGIEDSSFGPSFKGGKKNILGILRSNALLVSAGSRTGNDILEDVYNYFKDSLRFVGVSVNTAQILQKDEDKLDERVTEFLKIADTGIRKAQIETDAENLEQSNFTKRFAALAKEELGIDIDTEINKKKLNFYHIGKNDDLYKIDLPEESRGTLRLTILMKTIFKSLDEGSTVFVDELDASLHSLLSKSILEIYANKETNPNRAQIIATTHDTNILCSDKVRRDQIWFSEKSYYGATSLYPLTDIRTRNTDNIEKGYIQGRFGAVPVIGDMKKLF